MLRWLKSFLDPIPEPDGYSEKDQLLELLEGKFVLPRFKIVYTVFGGKVLMSPLGDDLDYGIRLGLKQVVHDIEPLDVFPDFVRVDERTLKSTSAELWLFKIHGVYMGPFVPTGNEEGTLESLENGVVLPY